MKLPGTIARLVASARTVKASSGVGYLAQFRKFAWFWWRIRASRTDFYQNSLWDDSRPYHDRLTVLCWADRKWLVDPQAPREARIRLRNKLWSGAKLAAAGLATPSAIGTLEVDPEGASEEQRGAVRHLLETLPAEGIVLKPSAGREGGGVLVLLPDANDGVVDLRGSGYSEKRLVDHLEHWGGGAWIIQHRLIPHPDLLPMMGTTLGTVRVLTLRFRDGTATCERASLKIPRLPGSPVDNFAEGNLAAMVDIPSGRLGPATDLGQSAWYEDHPSTGARIAGVVLPCWPDVLAAARAGAQCFPEIHSLGWDIAITTRGVIVLEANSEWGHEILQVPQRSGLVQGGFRRLLEEDGLGFAVRAKARTPPA